MEQLLTFFVFIFAYMTIPLAIRYVILRRPIENKWIAIGILVPIFIGFSVLINIQRDEMGRKIDQAYGMPHTPRTHMLGTPILFGAMIASYFILRRSRKEADDNTVPFTDGVEKHFASLPDSSRKVTLREQKSPPSNLTSNTPGANRIVEQIPAQDVTEMSEEERLDKWPLLEKSEEDLFAMAHAECQSESRRPGLWAKCIGESLGEENKAEAFYINYRAQQLIDERQQQIKAYDNSKRAYEELCRSRVFRLFSCPNCGMGLQYTNEQMTEFEIAAADNKFNWRQPCPGCGTHFDIRNYISIS